MTQIANLQTETPVLVLPFTIPPHDTSTTGHPWVASVSMMIA